LPQIQKAAPSFYIDGFDLDALSPTRKRASKLKERAE
jgi:hypothetical protein